ncbi:MAG: hypothetical protein ACYDAO_02250 [Thermoplasmataceae archaeon]
MVKLKLSYELGLIGSVILLIISVLVMALHSLSAYIRIFGTYPSGSAVQLLIFALIALLGTEISRRDKKVGYSTMIVISIAGVIAFPGLAIIGFLIVLIGGILVFLNK